MSGRSSGRIVFTLLFLAALAAGGYFAYQYFLEKIYGPNVQLPEGKKSAYFYISTGMGYDDVVAELRTNDLLRDYTSFEMLADRMNYKRVYPGRYKLVKNMSNRELISMLRAGKHVPVNLRINQIDYAEDLATLAGDSLEASTDEILELLKDKDFLGELGFNPSNAFGMFIANTYQFNWHTSSRGFLIRMSREYEKFWTDARLKKASDMGFTPYEVHTLAAIVQEEATKRDEMPRIAGVYLNRLRIGMPLQADPTVRYALGDKSKQRVYNTHTRVESPYNTYLHRGLPPGPITIPQTDVLDAVLNAEKHQFIFFVAKDDLSGYHNFSRTYEEHQQFARRYRAALDRHNIR